MSENFVKGICPACLGHVEFPEEGIGQSINCPHCEFLFELRKPDLTPAKAGQFPRPEIEFKSLSTSDGELFGRVFRSPNQIFMLLCKDEWITGAQNKCGSFYLFRAGQEIYKGKMERPNDGRIANNGNFILTDWIFPSDEPQSVFYAFNHEGRKLIEQKLDAAIYTSHISDDGNFAACQTCENNEAIAEQTLFAFDLNASKMLWHTQPPFWPEVYEFDSQKLELTIRGVSPIYKTCILSLVPPPPKKRKARKK